MVGSRFSTTMGRGFAMGVSLAQSSKPGRVDVAARVDRGGQRTATRKSAYRLHRVYAPERPRVPGSVEDRSGDNRRGDDWNVPATVARVSATQIDDPECLLEGAQSLVRSAHARHRW